MSKNIHFGIVYEKRANICHQSICKSILDPMCMSNPNIFITEAYKISMSTNTKQREWKAETYCLRDTRLTISLASGWYDNTDIAEVNHVRAHRNVSCPRFSVQTPPLIHQQWVHVLVGNPRVFRPQRDTSLLAEDGKLGVLAVWDALWQLYVVRLRQNFQTWFRSIRCRFRLLASRTGPALNQCKQETFFYLMWSANFIFLPKPTHRLTITHTWTWCRSELKPKHSQNEKPHFIPRPVKWSIWYDVI